MLWPLVHRLGWLRMKGQTLPRAGRAHRARQDLVPHRGQLARVNRLYVDGDWHLSITVGVRPMTNAGW
jgi:hypothetical protein